MRTQTIALEPGFYYARWIENNGGVLWRLACNCGHRSRQTEDLHWLQGNADRLHRGH